MLHGGNQYYYEPEKAWENKEKKTYRIYHRNLFVAKSIKEAKYVWTVWNTSRYPYQKTKETLLIDKPEILNWNIQISDQGKFILRQPNSMMVIDDSFNIFFYEEDFKTGSLIQIQNFEECSVFVNDTYYYFLNGSQNKVFQLRQQYWYTPPQKNLDKVIYFDSWTFTYFSEEDTKTKREEEAKQEAKKDDVDQIAEQLGLKKKAYCFSQVNYSNFDSPSPITLYLYEEPKYIKFQYEIQMPLV